MAGITKTILSGSTDGKQILVTGTGTGATVTIHTADATATDYITLFANNAHSASVLLTIEWGGTTDPNDIIEVTLPKVGVEGDGERAIVIRKPLTNSLVVKAFASVANVVKISGDVNRVS